MIAFLAGVFLSLLAVVSAWRTVADWRRGKAYVWTDLSGRGVAGAAASDERPSFFRTVLLSNLLSSVGLAIVGLMLIFWANF